MKSITKLLLSLFIVIGLSAPVLGSELQKEVKEEEVDYSKATIFVEKLELEVTQSDEHRIYRPKQKINKGEMQAIQFMLLNPDNEVMRFVYHQGRYMASAKAVNKETVTEAFLKDTQLKGNIILWSVPRCDRNNHPKEWDACLRYVTSKEEVDSTPELTDLFVVRFHNVVKLK